MSVESVAMVEPASPKARRGVSLTSVEVAPENEVAPVLRSARAEVAALGLKVRGAQRQAETVETQAGAAESVMADNEARARFDEGLAGYRRELDDAFAARRRELDADLARERSEAESAVEEARAEAVSIVGSATDQLQRLLERISSGAAPLAAPSMSPADHGGAPAPDPLPTSVKISAPTVAEPDAAVEFETLPPPPVLPPAQAVIEPDALAPAAVAPVLSPAAVAPVEAASPAAPYLAFVLPAPDPSASPAIYPAPAYMGQPMMVPDPATTMPGQPMMMPGQPMMMPGQPMMMPGQPMMMPGMMPAGMAMASFPPEPVERESFFRRLWHLDVMAPIIAVLIVLAILAAWVL